MPDIYPAELPLRALYRLLPSVVVPRPIAWVSSLSSDGVPNVAPHSYFVILSSDPPMLGFVSTGLKDTVRNIRATGEYVINIAGEELAEQLNLSSADFPPGESEFAWAGLTPEPSQMISAPAVGEAPVALELRLSEIKELGNAPSYLVIGDLVHVRIAERVMRGDQVPPELLRAFGRLGGAGYARTTDRFELERPTYADLSEREREGRPPE